MLIEFFGDKLSLGAFEDDVVLQVCGRVRFCCWSFVFLS